MLILKSTPIYRVALVKSLRLEGIEGTHPLLHSSCRMAEGKLTAKAVKTRPFRVDTAREATLSVPAQQYRD